MNNQNDGLFTIPYTQHDWIVLSISMLGTLFRLSLVNINKDSKQRISFADTLNTILVSAIMTIGLYEWAISSKWKIEQLYLPFAGIIIGAKVIVDWLFMSEDGKIFIISTFKQFVGGIFEKFGYTKKEEE